MAVSPLPSLNGATGLGPVRLALPEAGAGKWAGLGLWEFISGPQSDGSRRRGAQEGPRAGQRGSGRQCGFE